MHIIEKGIQPSWLTQNRRLLFDDLCSHHQVLVGTATLAQGQVEFATKRPWLKRTQCHWEVEICEMATTSGILVAPALPRWVDTRTVHSRCSAVQYDVHREEMHDKEFRSRSTSCVWSLHRVKENGSKGD